MTEADPANLKALMEELLRREEAQESLAKYIEYVSGMKPPPHIELLCEKLEAVADGRIKRLMISMPPGHAKALALDTPIPTPDGWRVMGDLRVGDYVFDEMGAPTRVVGVSEIWRNRPVYRVTTAEGDEITADEAHEWTVRRCRKRGVWKTYETGDLYRKQQAGQRPAKVMVAGELQLPEREYAIHPYVLGCWLGDGTSTTAQFTSMDDEIVQRLHAIEGGELRVASQRKVRAIAFRVGPDGSTDRAACLATRLRSLGVMGDKHIPEEYFWGSIEQRWDLLHGLMDTDGTVSKAGQAFFSSTNERLARGFQQLAFSLGLKPTLTSRPAKLNGVQHGTHWRVSFYSANAAWLPRKRERARDAGSYKFRHLKFEPAGRADTVCIEVEAESHLFLCGRSMVPTHNSFTASQYFPAWYLSKYGKKNLISATHTQDLSDSFGLKVRNIIKSDEHQRVFPESGISTDKTAAGEWMTLEDGSYKATAVGASVTGRRGHLLLGDDLLSGIEAAESESHRKKLWAWYNSDFYTRRVDDDTAIILIGTRWHLGDHFGRLDQEEKDGTGEKWERVILPALALENDPMGRKPGEALWESQFSRANLEKIKKRSSTTARMWSSLYQQSPVVDSGGIIDGTWFKWWRQVEPPKIQYVLQAWDTALTASKTSAYSASTTWGVFEDENEVPNIILLSAWRDRVEWPILRRMVQRMASDYRDDNYRMPVKPKAGRKPDTVLVEAKANGQMLISDLSRAGIVATPFNPDKYGDKIARVRLITDLIENGRVWLPAAGPTFEVLRKWAEEFHSQCVQFPASDSRDWVDTMTMAFLRIKASGWVANTEDPMEERYDTPLERTAFY